MRRRVPLLVLALGLAAATVPSLALLGAATLPGLVHELRVERRLDLTRAPAPVVERRAAYRWLLEHDPAALVADLVERPDGRVTTVTGDYIPARAPGSRPAPLEVSPMPADLTASGALQGRMLRAWSGACLDDETLACGTARLVAALLAQDDHDVTACFVRTLRHETWPGLRRMAFVWLVEHAGLPVDHDWRAPTVTQLMASGFRRLPADHPAVLRDEALRARFERR